jgi:hypothetical protein
MAVSYAVRAWPRLGKLYSHMLFFLDCQILYRSLVMF